MRESGPGFALKELSSTPGAPELPSVTRKFGVGLAGGGQGGSPRHPPAHIACKSVKRARTFCAAHKSLAACADLLPLACFPGSECGVTPLPQFPRPSRTPCKPQPAAARVKFRFLPTHPSLNHPQRPATLHRHSSTSALPSCPTSGGASWRGNSNKGKVGQKRSKEKPHRRRTKKRKGNRLNLAETSAHGNGARQRAIPPRRGAKKRRMEFVKEVYFLLEEKILSNQGRVRAAEMAEGLFRKTTQGTRNNGN